MCECFFFFLSRSNRNYLKLDSDLEIWGMPYSNFGITFLFFLKMERERERERVKNSFIETIKMGMVHQNSHDLMES